MSTGRILHSRIRTSTISADYLFGIGFCALAFDALLTFIARATAAATPVGTAISVGAVWRTLNPITLSVVTTCFALWTVTTTATAAIAAANFIVAIREAPFATLALSACFAHHAYAAHGTASIVTALLFVTIWKALSIWTDTWDIHGRGRCVLGDGVYIPIQSVTWGN